MNKLVEDVREMIVIIEKQQGGIKAMGVLCYLKGVRDALDGIDINQVVKNVNNVISSRR